MKNVHLLPTDKPSRLFDFMTALVLTDKVSPNDSGTNHHIYITSDEEIKEGDWVYCNIDNTIDIASDRTNYHRNEFEKIILTTDQDLIKDGVQAIDDKFLEWFVKNPSYEEIKAEYKFIPHNITQDDFCITCDSNGCNLDDKEKYKYKIVIPQEEPKQEIVGYKLKPSIDRMIVDGILKNAMPIWNDEDKSVYFIRGHVAGSLVAKMKELQVLDLWFTPIYENEEVKSDWVKEHHLEYYHKEGIMKPKKETLEEAAEQFEYTDGVYGFKQGAKWQAERMYSEEEVKQIIDATLIEYSDFVLADVPHWFEQFKKK
jgi:hypothetical protein